MITTIQIRKNVKNELDKLKSGKESYEEVILTLMKIAERCKREQKELLVQSYKEMARESTEIDEEWNSADKD